MFMCTCRSGLYKSGTLAHALGCKSEHLLYNQVVKWAGNWFHGCGSDAWLRLYLSPITSVSAASIV